jgi:hypothetical protein
MEDDDFVPTEVPGLEEAADSWYDLEGMERPLDSTEPADAPPVVGTLPFGFQGESQTYRPNLPFGIGSFAQGMPFSQADVDVHAPAEPPLPSSRAPSHTAVSPSHAGAQGKRTLAPGEQTSVPLPGRAPADAQAASSIRASHRMGEVDRVPLPTQTPASMSSSAEVPSTAANDGVSVDAIASSPPPPSPSAPLAAEVDASTSVRLSSARLVTASAPMGVPPAEPEVEAEAVDVPDYWNVDAPIPDYTELYAVGEQVVEVVHDNVESDVVVYDHDDQEASAVFHSPLEASVPDGQTSGLRLKLHPAQAMAVEVEGHPEHSEWLRNGYTAMASSSWGQAARAFQQLAGQRPNDAAVLNNYGISLLQRAIAMAEAEGDAEHPTVAAQFESAILALREAAKNSPADGDVLVNLAHALLESGRSEKALGIINVHLSRQPNDVKGLNTQAVAMARLGQIAHSIDVLKRIQGDATAAENLVQFTG